MAFKNILKLDSTQIEYLKSISQENFYSTETALFYEGQIPVTAILLIEGQINITKGKKVKTTLRSAMLLGVKELMNNAPSTTSAIALANTLVCFLDKSTIMEIINNNDDLSILLKEICEA